MLNNLSEVQNDTWHSGFKINLIKFDDISLHSGHVADLICRVNVHSILTYSIKTILSPLSQSKLYVALLVLQARNETFSKATLCQDTNGMKRRKEEKPQKYILQVTLKKKYTTLLCNMSVTY